MSDEDLQRVYSWVDEIPLSRAKRNITRDFSDGGACSSSRSPRDDAHRGFSLNLTPIPRSPLHMVPAFRAVLLAEVIRHYFPKLIDMHNYVRPRRKRERALSRQN